MEKMKIELVKDFYSTFLNRSSIKMLAINKKKKKKKKKKYFFFDGPFFVGAGEDENLKINFLWPYVYRIMVDTA